MITKQLIKISKQLLLDLGIYKTNVNSPIEPEYKDYSKCANCPLNEYKNTVKGADFCNNQCVFVLSNSSVMPKKVVKSKKTLTHSQINQILFYHSSVFDGNGETLELSNKEVAKALNCSERTARDNIKALEDAGYIFINYKTEYKYKVFVRDYYKYHNKNTRGYLYINDKCFKSLLKINNINTLRFALNALVKLDDMRVSKATKVKKEFTLKSIMNFLPSNITCKKQVVEIIKQAKDIFNIKFTIDSVIVAFKSYTDSVKTKVSLESNNKKAINKLIKRFGIANVSKKDKEDMLQMSVQYSIHLVANALNLLNEFIPNELGAYLRSIIRKNLNNKAYSFLKIS